MIEVAQKTAMIGTDYPDDDSQQGPEQTDARPRTDSSSVARRSDADLDRCSAVARYDVADLEPTTDELGREKESVESSTQQG